MDSSNLSLVVFFACFTRYSQVQIFDWQFGRLLVTKFSYFFI